MNDAQPRSTFEEYTLPSVGSLQHRGSIIGKVGFDDERRQMSCSFLRLQAAGYHRLVERPINRQFDRNIPIRRATRTRVPAPIVCMD
jgi:hypothetical protein